MFVYVFKLHPLCGVSILSETVLGKAVERTSEKGIFLRNYSKILHAIVSNNYFKKPLKLVCVLTCPFRSCRVPLPCGWSASQSPMYTPPQVSRTLSTETAGPWGLRSRSSGGGSKAAAAGAPPPAPPASPAAAAAPAWRPGANGGGVGAGVKDASVRLSSSAVSANSMWCCNWP